MAATQPTSARQKSVLSPAQARKEYVLKLDGPLSTAAEVQKAGNLPLVPETYDGSSDVESGTGSSIFCKIDGRTKAAIENWLLNQRSSFRPLLVPVGTAYKELDPNSLYPTLGKDTTLPQFRPEDSHLLTTIPSYGPAQEEYPVWYFFYGTLASVPKLCSVFSLTDQDEVPVLRKAIVRGGRMKTWGMGKYNALVDGEERDCVEGWAYLVVSREHEDSLRKYETEGYEVVRCEIEFEGGERVRGCTFRFIGEVSELEEYSLHCRAE
jgi:hypothetical protein